jgi:hypothetical protein
MGGAPRTISPVVQRLVQFSFEYSANYRGHLSFLYLK